MPKLYLQLNEPGSGEIAVPLDSAAGADIAISKYIALKYRGRERGGFFVENVERVQVTAGEKEGRWVKASGRGTLAIIDDAIVWDWLTPATENVRKFGTTDLEPGGGVPVPKGLMLYKLLDEAKNWQINPAMDIIDRECFPNLRWDFDETIDSVGTPWTDAEDIEFRVGMSLLDVLRQMAALGMDFNIERELHGDFLLHAYDETVGLGADLSATIFFRVGQNCIEVSDKEVGSEIRNTVLVEFTHPDIPYVKVEDAGSRAAYRPRESLLQASNAETAASAAVYGQAELDVLKDPKKVITLKVSDAVGARVFEDYDIGDWIAYDDGTGTIVDYRIRGLQLEWGDNWYADVIVELNSIMLETDIRTARDIRKIGAASSGSALVNPVTTGTVVSSAAVGDFQVGDGAGWTRKTLAQTRQILYPMGAAVVDADGSLPSATAQLNTLLARLRALGLITP